MMARSLVLLSAFVLGSDAYSLGVAASVSHSRAMRVHPHMMAGFGGAAAKPAKGKGKKAAKVDKTSGVKPRAQWDKFKDLVANGAPRVQVFASLDGEAWTEVGEVAVAEPGTAQQAGMLLRVLEPRISPPRV